MKIISKMALAASILLTSIGLAGCQGSNANSNNASQSSATSEKNTKLAEYNGVIKTARTLNQDGQYQASNKALNQIEISDLSKSGYSSIKKEYFDLQKSNDNFLLKKNGTTSDNSQTTNNTTNTPSRTNSSFNGYGKYTGDYYFYNDDDGDRNQSDLNISSNGTVIQNNQDGSTYSGSAVVKPSGQSNVLSYDVSSGSNDTKTIKADVEIDVTWSNGEKEVYYGYTGYDDSIVLTDGQSYSGDQVNEVWQKF